jgi:hypothetical protein
MKGYAQKCLAVNLAVEEIKKALDNYIRSLFRAFCFVNRGGLEPSTH